MYHIFEGNAIDWEKRRDNSMPKIYLSPSTQDWNMYVTGSGSEEYNMNLLADALVPYLLSNGIQYQRNRPEMTAGSSIREASTMAYIFVTPPTASFSARP